MTENSNAVGESTVPTETTSESAKSAESVEVEVAPIHVDPFDFSEDKEPSIFEDVDFTLNDEGEMEITGSKIDAGDVDVSGGDQKEIVEAKQVVSDEPANILEDGDYSSDPFGSADVEEFNRVSAENKSLKDRLEKVESKLSTDDVAKSNLEREQKLRGKLESAGFGDEQIDAILEVTDAVKVDKVEDKIEEGTPEVSQVQIAQEVQKVFKLYNGQNGKPSTMDMRDHINYIGVRFKDQNIDSLTLDAKFRIAENSLFIHWMDANWPNQTRNMSLRDLFTASESLRSLYYKKQGKPVNTYTHITELGQSPISSAPVENASGNGQAQKVVKQTDGPNVSNEQIAKLAKQEQSLNVPGGEIETEANIKERKRPKTAREVATASIMGAFGDS